MPNLYFILMLVILLFFGVFITIQLFNISIAERLLFKSKQTCISSVQTKELFNLVKILILKKLWFTSIKLLEAHKVLSKDQMHKYFNIFGFIYYQMRQYDLAQLYYLKAIKVKSDYVVALQNLLKIYEKKKNQILIDITCTTILRYDVNNHIANKYIKKNR